MECDIRAIKDRKCHNISMANPSKIHSGVWLQALPLNHTNIAASTVHLALSLFCGIHTHTHTLPPPLSLSLSLSVHKSLLHRYSFFSCFLVALGSIPHRADKDFEVGEYVIPKGATVMAITRGLMYDPKVSIHKTFPHSALSCGRVMFSQASVCSQ